VDKCAVNGKYDWDVFWDRVVLVIICVILGSCAWNGYAHRAATKKLPEVEQGIAKGIAANLSWTDASTCTQRVTIEDSTEIDGFDITLWSRNVANMVEVKSGGSWTLLGHCTTRMRFTKENRRKYSIEYLFARSDQMCLSSNAVRRDKEYCRSYQLAVYLDDLRSRRR
jgi:hypothetical protein